MVIDGLSPLLQVFDIPTSVAFYRDVLGFAVVSMSGKNPADSDWVMLKVGSSTMMLNTAYERHDRPAAPDSSRIESHRDTILYFGCDDADAIYAHLRSKGWNAKAPTTTHYGMR